MLVADRRNHGFAHAVIGMEAKLLAPFIEHVDGACVGPRQLSARPTMVVRTVSRSSVEFTAWGHFAERAQLLDRAAKLIGALA